jgi:hypothetical protein
MQFFAGVSRIAADDGVARRGSDQQVRRVVTDDRTGAQWIIDERDATQEPGARGDRYLCYDSQDTRRRVWRYPANWRELPDPALIQLAQHKPLSD